MPLQTTTHTETTTAHLKDTDTSVSVDDWYCTVKDQGLGRVLIRLHGPLNLHINVLVIKVVH